MSQHQSLNSSSNIFQYFFFFFRFYEPNMFFISKIQDFFFLYSKKQVFENRKQKLLLNITLPFQIHFPTDSLSFLYYIKILFFHYSLIFFYSFFFIFLYSPFIQCFQNFQQSYFSMVFFFFLLMIIVFIYQIYVIWNEFIH